MSDRRRRHPDAGVLLSGSSEEVELLSTVAAAAIGRAPRLASDFEATLARFVRDTAPARARAVADFGPAEPAPVAAAGRARSLAALGTTLLIVTVLASPIAALAPLPARADYDIDPEFATLVSAIAAAVCAVAAGIGVLLPAWGTRESNDQAWKLHYAAAVILGIGLIAGAFGLGDIVPVGAPLWLAWFIGCVIALGAAVLGAETRRRRGQGTAGMQTPAQPAPGSDDEFFAAIVTRRDRAIRETDQLANADPEVTQRVDRDWRAGIEAARNDGAISRIAFESALSMSAMRWQLERAAQPEFTAGAD